MTIRVLVVDDEPLARRGIIARLERHPDTEVAGQSASGRDAIAAIRALAPDLVFLDVQMPEVDGLEVVRQVGAAAMPLVIFVTAFDSHAVEAFEVHALDYLLKPIDDERFDRALTRVRDRMAGRRHEALGKQLADLVAGNAGHPMPPREQRIAVRDRGNTVFVDLDDLDWLAADGDYVRLYAGGRALLLRETMNGMESRLDSGRFVRIHRSTIVNAQRVRELRPLPNGEQVVILRDGTQLRLSRTYRRRLGPLLGEPR